MNSTENRKENEQIADFQLTIEVYLLVEVYTC